MHEAVSMAERSVTPEALRKRGETVFASMLDVFPLGVILLGPDGRVRWMSRAAEKELSSRSILQIEPNGTLGSPNGSMHTLANLIDHARRSVRSVLGPRLGLVSVPLEAGEHPIHLCVTPLFSRSEEVTAAVGVAVFVCTGMISRPRAPLLFERLYGLTPAEARIAARLMDGSNIAEIARVLGITSNTARTHLSRILAKTGTRRQAELISLLASGLASLDFDALTML